MPFINKPDLTENQITDYIEASVTLEENNLHSQAQEMRLKANDVIKAYLQRDGNEPTTADIEALETKVFEFVNHLFSVTVIYLLSINVSLPNFFVEIHWLCFDSSVLVELHNVFLF